ncbi:MAG: hypothetical protein ACTSPH_00280 [Promethearchaeota archaeon]
MLDVEKLFITVNNVRLEAEYFQSKTNPFKGGILICHPHPQFYWK